MGEKIENSRILASLEAINDLIEKDDVPVKLRYAAKKNQGTLESEKDDLEAFQTDLLTEHAQINMETGMVETEEEEYEKIKFESEEDREMYTSAMEELYEEEEELDLYKVNLRKVEDAELPPEMVFTLRWMFEEGNVS